MTCGSRFLSWPAGGSPPSTATSKSSTTNSSRELVARDLRDRETLMAVLLLGLLAWRPGKGFSVPEVRSYKSLKLRALIPLAVRSEVWHLLRHDEPKSVSPATGCRRRSYKGPGAASACRLSPRAFQSQIRGCIR